MVMNLRQRKKLNWLKMLKPEKNFSYNSLLTSDYLHYKNAGLNSTTVLSEISKKPLHKLCMYMLLFFFRQSIVFAFE